MNTGTSLGFPYKFSGIILLHIEVWRCAQGQPVAEQITSISESGSGIHWGRIPLPQRNKLRVGGPKDKVERKRKRRRRRRRKTRLRRGWRTKEEEAEIVGDAGREDTEIAGMRVPLPILRGGSLIRIEVTKNLLI